MTHPDFSLMTDAQLRAYVLAHREDREAFHAYVDRMATRPPIAIIEPEEWSEERMQQILFGDWTTQIKVNYQQFTVKIKNC